ncbi:MAG: type II toxin-antitoxin system RelE family toxin [Candidatus Acidiferrales bacterium]
MYVSNFTPDALAGIKALPRNVRNALKKEFKKKIHRDPVGCSEPLSESLAGFRSFHFQNYRVIYRVYEDLKVVAVVGVGKKDSAHHAEIYQKLEKLAASGKLADSVLKAIRLFSSH